MTTLCDEEDRNGTSSQVSNWNLVALAGPSPAPRVALIVEDDETLRHALTGLLEDEKFEVMTATSAARARYVLFDSSHPVGVVVLDLSLSDGPGDSLIEALNQHGSGSPAMVLVSADAQRVVPLATAYAIPYLTKPFDMNVLATTIVVAYEHGLRPHKNSTSGRSGMRRRVEMP